MLWKKKEGSTLNRIARKLIQRRLAKGMVMFN